MQLCLHMCPWMSHCPLWMWLWLLRCLIIPKVLLLDYTLDDPLCIVFATKCWLDNEAEHCGLLHWSYVNGTGGLVWHKSRCLVVGTLAMFCCICRNLHPRLVIHPPYGPWDHVPPHVWTDKSNLAATQDEGEDEAHVCALCCQKRSTITGCGERQEYYCDECVDAHTCGEK